MRGTGFENSRRFISEFRSSGSSSDSGVYLCAFWALPFFIQRQSRAEESQLREQERFCLEKTQRLFREVFLRRNGKNAISTLPSPPLHFNEMRVWDKFG
jgi:hypothetical protein